MKGRKALGLLIMFVSLCAGYWLMVHEEKNIKKHANEARKLFSFPAGDIVSVQVQRVAEKLIVGQRQESGVWTITQPNANIEPNQVTWERLAGAVAGLSNMRTINADPAAMAQYGLDKPVLQITAQKADASAVTLSFGALDPTQKYRYSIAKGGQLDDTVFLTDVKTFTDLDRPLSLLRYPYVLNTGDESIRRLEFAWVWTGGETEPEKAKDANAKPQVGDESTLMAVERSGDGPWRLTSPKEAVANQETVEAFVKELQYGTGRNYIDEPKELAQYGLNPARARITIYCGNKSPQTLYLGTAESVADKSKKESGGIFAKRKEYPSVFVMDSAIMDMLPKSPEAFRESRLFSGAVGDIESIDYTAGQTHFVLRNDAQKGWKIVEPAVDDTDQVAVSGFLALLKIVQGRGFPGAAAPEYGLDNPAVTIAFKFKNGSQPASIRIGAKVPAAEKYYVMQDNGVVTIVNALEVNGLTKSIFDFRQMTFLAFNKDEAAKVEMTFDGKRYVFEKPRGQWLLKEPEGGVLGSPDDMNALLDNLSGMRAVGIELETPPANPADYGLDAPLASIGVTVIKTGENAAPPAVVGPLTIGKTTPNNSQQRFAASPSHPGVYRVKQGIVDIIRDILNKVH